jgi:hypothetical protein
MAGPIEYIAWYLARISYDASEADWDRFCLFQPTKITAVGVMTAPVSVGDNSVFIPRLVGLTLNPAVFAILAAAVTVCGGYVITDVIEVDTSAAKTRLAAPKGTSLIVGCIDALQILFSNYELHGGGEIAAYAATRGIHRGVSVVSHADEGGYVRSVFRRNNFGIPFGGLNYRYRRHTGLPIVGEGNVGALNAWVDSIALGTAALVALSDPGVMVDDKTFATVFSVPESLSVSARQSALANDIAQRCGDFVANYLDLLARSFAFSPSDTNARRHLEACFLDAAGCNERHLSSTTVAPWFWIEPTSLVTSTLLRSATNDKFCGVSACPDKGSSFPLFTRIREGSDAGLHRMSYYVRFTNARTCGLVLHYNGHRLDGLGHVRLVQMDPEQVVLPGGAGDYPTRFDSDVTLGESIWVRGQSPIAHPAEFSLVSGTFGCDMRHQVQSSDDQWEYDYTNLPSPTEVLTGHVITSVSRPHPLEPGPLGTYEREINRARSQGVRSLRRAVTEWNRRMDTSPVIMLKARCTPNIVFGDVPHGIIATVSSKVDNATPAETEISLGNVVPVTMHLKEQSGPSMASVRQGQVYTRIDPHREGQDASAAGGATGDVPPAPPEEL